MISRFKVKRNTFVKVFFLCHTALNGKYNNFIWDIIMLKKITAISLALTLTACANTGALEENISTLTNKVDALSAQVADLEAQQQTTTGSVQAANVAAEQAASDAKAANERMNNIVASYKK